MFTPEFVSEERGEYTLVANHSLENAEAIELSIAYNRARIEFGVSQLPAHLQRCRLIYDIRGQVVSESVISQIREALSHACALEFKS
ncbi:hypothetical protein HHX48_11820 [Salinimonas sp. HHU 13199]|uniref:Uncharacterized protein n=1 Tax=Salinimonas profundi TaxID=2729140 RepID=A0ABR8LJQ2_9ALTE|nr:hypothetical protein [Salinimonas profundi]MBD3586427.1 hypothetical protein [Salinimonas profundi]